MAIKSDGARDLIQYLYYIIWKLCGRGDNLMETDNYINVIGTDRT